MVVLQLFVHGVLFHYDWISWGVVLPCSWFVLIWFCRPPCFRVPPTSGRHFPPLTCCYIRWFPGFLSPFVFCCVFRVSPPLRLFVARLFVCCAPPFVSPRSSFARCVRLCFPVAVPPFSPAAPVVLLVPVASLCVVFCPVVQWVGFCPFTHFFLLYDIHFRCIQTITRWVRGFVSYRSSSTMESWVLNVISILLVYSKVEECLGACQRILGAC